MQTGMFYGHCFEMLNNFTFELVFLSESNKTMARVCEQRGRAGGRACVPSLSPAGMTGGVPGHLVCTRTTFRVVQGP